MEGLEDIIFEVLSVIATMIGARLLWVLKNYKLERVSVQGSELENLKTKYNNVLERLDRSDLANQQLTVTVSRLQELLKEKDERIDHLEQVSTSQKEETGRQKEEIDSLKTRLDAVEDEKESLEDKLTQSNAALKDELHQRQLIQARADALQESMNILKPIVERLAENGVTNNVKQETKKEEDTQ